MDSLCRLPVATGTWSCRVANRIRVLSALVFSLYWVSWIKLAEHRTLNIRPKSLNIRNKTTAYRNALQATVSIVRAIWWNASSASSYRALDTLRAKKGSVVWTPPFTPVDLSFRHGEEITVGKWFIKLDDVLGDDVDRDSPLSHYL